jgi:glutaconate CoA-transferase subunit A
LRLILAPGGAVNADLLIGAGAVASVEMGNVLLGELGFAPCFTRLAQAGRLEVRDSACPVVLAGLQAGAMGLPFLPFRGLLETDTIRLHPEWKVGPNPFDPGEEILLIPPIVPDVAAFHARKADRFGNALAAGTGDARLLAQAAKGTIVTAEEVVDHNLMDELDRNALISGIYVTAVVPAPLGAYPGGCAGFYEADHGHLREYAAAARTEEGFHAYLGRFIAETGDEAGYLAAARPETAASR